MIKEILDNLESEKKRRLVHAFNNEFSQYVELENNHFIGVNMVNIANLEMIESVGRWSYGRINKHE